MFSRRNSVAILSLFLFALLVSAGCGSKTVAPKTTEVVLKDLVGKVWVLQNLFERELADGSRLTMEFMEDGTVRGNGGCNNFSGPYTLTGEKISFGQMLATRKACSAVTDEQEFSFFHFLSLIDEVMIDGDEMELYSQQSGEPMRFEIAE